MASLEVRQQALAGVVFNFCANEPLHLNLKFTGQIANVDYEKDMCTDSYHRVSLLKDICGLKFISDSYFIKCYVYYLPEELKFFLMKKAIQNDRFLTIKFLLKFWPYEVFDLSSFSNTSSWKLFFISKDAGYISQYLRSWNECLCTVLNSFVEIIKNHEDTTKLTCVDVSEIPVGDEYVNIISKFAKQRLTIPLSEKTHDETIQPHLRKYKTQVKYIIKMQCTVNNPHTLVNLCSAIQAGQVGESSLELVVTGLRLTDRAFVFEHICNLLNILNPENLQLFSLGFGSIRCKLFLEILSSLKKFHNLKVLDLAYSGIDYTLHEKLAVLLRNLVHLCHIDFGNCILGGKIELLLKQLHCTEMDENTQKNVCLPFNKKTKRSCELVSCNDLNIGKLSYLGLEGCRILEKDIIYLANSHHTKTLMNLNLSYNILGSCIQSFSKLLEATSSTLCVLEIENCHFTHLELSQLFITLSKLCKLKFLNISNLQVESQYLLTCLAKLNQLSNLQCISLSYPTDYPFVPLTSPELTSERTKELLAIRLQIRTAVENVLNYSSKNIEIMWT